MTGCPNYVNAFFARLIPLVRPMAKRLALDEDYILTLSIHEHGWIDEHNDKLHNLFGTTHAGGANLAYASDEEAARSWETKYGGMVRGSASIEDFVARLRSLGYNTATKSYDSDMMKTYHSVVIRKAACGVK